MKTFVSTFEPLKYVLGISGRGDNHYHFRGESSGCGRKSVFTLYDSDIPYSSISATMANVS